MSLTKPKIIAPRLVPSDLGNKLISIFSRANHVVILSPHLDDAVLSMGTFIGYLAQQKVNITVINIFTRGSTLVTPLTTKLLSQSNINNANDYFLIRKKEDINSLKILGDIRVRNLDYVDAAWRSNRAGLPLYPITTLNLDNQNDKNLKLNLNNKLKSLIEIEKPNIVFAPLGVGKHIDHVITRTALHTIFSKKIYYLDFPYSSWHSEETKFIKEEHLHWAEWKEVDYSKKATSILEYESQYASLFQNGDLQLTYERFFSSLL